MGEVPALVVHPEARRRGIATAMMAFMEELAREKGASDFGWSADSGANG